MVKTHRQTLHRGLYLYIHILGVQQNILGFFTTFTLLEATAEVKPQDEGREAVALTPYHMTNFSKTRIQWLGHE